MGRRPVGKRAMTDAERQRRRRKRLQKEENTKRTKAAAARHRYENDKAYIAMPPGITIWRHVQVKNKNDELVTIWQPHVKPLAACRTDLEDEDILALLDELHGMAQERGIDLSRLPPYPQPTRPAEPDEGTTVSGLPRASRPGPPGSMLDLVKDVVPPEKR